MKQNTPRFIKFRHRVFRRLLGPFVSVICFCRYGSLPEKFRPKEKRPCLILYNHQTAFDQFLVSLAFHDPIYHVASDDLFSNGLSSKLISYLVAPIPIKKQATDIAAIKQCLRVSREGGSIAMAPEGNRTFSGRTEYMSRAVAPLARRMRLPVVLFRIEGGYGVHPRWSDVARRGKMRSYVSRVIEPEEYQEMTDDELFSTIKHELFVDETANTALYKHKKKAEYLERVLYVCPNCGLSSFESHGNVIACKQCGRRVIYHENKQLTGEGFDFPFSHVLGWYDHQQAFVNALDLSLHEETPLYRDSIALREVVPCKTKKLLCQKAELSLYGNRVEIRGDIPKITLDFDGIHAASVLGRNKLNLYYADKLYQFKGDKRFNAVKYVNFYYRYKNTKKETHDGKFLGL